MIVKLLPIQIKSFWQTIKYAMARVDGVAERDQQVYFNALLHSLLNDKSQCFVRLNKKRELLSIVITEIEINKITGIKKLNSKGLYSWGNISNESLGGFSSLIREFAKSQDCTFISFESKNPRVWELGEKAGFKEDSRKFMLRI